MLNVTKAASSTTASGPAPTRCRTPECDYSGMCKVVWDSGDSYDGGWLDGKKNFHGDLVHVQKGKVRFTYRGQFLNGLCHGMGSLRWWGDGISGVYNGAFENDIKKGYGELRESDGRMYLGMWDDDTFEGHGIFHTPEGEIIKGIWHKGELVRKLNLADAP